MREWLARQFVQREEWQKAIVIYEDLIESDLGYPGSVTGYREELLRLYRKTGNAEKTLETLWDLVCKSNNHNYYNELKSQYTVEDWIQEREKVFPCFNNYGQAQLLCEEKLYDRLWELLRNTDLHTVLGYEDVLLPKYAADILQKYSDYLNHAAVQASGRKAIKGGKELSKQIVSDWRIRYKNRSAMMDELKEL